MQIEMGIDTFGDANRDAAGEPVPHAQVIRDVIEQGVLADQVGVDFIGLRSMPVRMAGRRPFSAAAPSSSPSGSSATT